MQYCDIKIDNYLRDLYLFSVMFCLNQGNTNMSSLCLNILKKSAEIQFYVFNKLMPLQIFKSKWAHTWDQTNTNKQFLNLEYMPYVISKSPQMWKYIQSCEILFFRTSFFVIILVKHYRLVKLQISAPQQKDDEVCV